MYLFTDDYICVCVCVCVWNPRGAVANVLDCDIAVSEFELQSCD